MKPWSKFSIKLSLAAIAAVLLLCLFRWGATKDETWRCYDTSGHPAGGVLIMCYYGLPSYRESAVNFRFSDPSGKIVLDLDKDTPRGLMRSYGCIYSPGLKNGDVQLGKSWQEGEPIPFVPVYFDDLNKKIFIRPTAENDTSARHAAVEALISLYLGLRKDSNGGAKLGKELGPFVARERDEFLAKYGEEPVPQTYFDTATYRSSCDEFPARPGDNVKFKDITLNLPTP